METAPSTKAPWAKDLQKASWLALAVFFIYLVLTFFQINPYINISDNKIYLLSGFILLLPLSLVTLSVSSVIGTSKPFSDSGFWIRRAFLDLLLIGGLGNIFGFIYFAASIGNSFNDTLTSAVAQNFIPSSDFLFITELILVLTLFGLLGLRYIFGTLPKGLIKFRLSFSWTDLAIIVAFTVGVLIFSSSYEFILKLLNIPVPVQFEFSKDTLSGFGPVLIILAGAVLAPIAEEFFFRGYMLPLIATKNKVLAIIVTSLIWAAIHFNLIILPEIFLMGVVLAYVYLKRQNLFLTILIHGVNNFIAFMLILYGPK